MTVRRGPDGFSIVEALVATALAGIALASLSTVAALGRGSLVRARETSVAVALASERLEVLRAGPRANGSDVRVAAGGTQFSRQWTITDGRGGPSEMRVEVHWRDRMLAVATEVLP